MNKIIRSRKYGRFQWYLGLLLFAVLSQGDLSGTGLTGSAGIVCLQSSGKIISENATPQVKLSLVAEGLALRSTLIIDRGVSTFDGQKLNSSLRSLRDVVPARFRSFCGKSYVRGFVLGGFVEHRWALGKPQGEGKAILAVSFPLDSNSNQRLLEYLGQEATEIAKFAGAFTGASTLTSLPATWLGAEQFATRTEVLVKALERGHELQPIVIDTILGQLDDTTVRRLQRGDTISSVPRI